jgi:hypothetical protein
MADEFEDAPDLTDGDDGGAFEPPDDDGQEVDLPEVIDDPGDQGG